MGGNKMTEKNEETKKIPPKKLSYDLAVTIPIGILGGVLGYINSWVNPLAMPNCVKDIRNGEIKNFSDFVYYTAGTLVYFCGVSNIVEKIIEDHENPVNYIPVGLNIVSGVGQIAYKVGKGKRLEASLKEDNKIIIS